MNKDKRARHESEKRTLIVAVMISGVFLAVLNQTVLSPALPSIMEDLHITAAEGQWLTTAFLLVNGIMIPITAYFIDRFTTRQLFLSSMLMFAVGNGRSRFCRQLRRSPAGQDTPGHGRRRSDAYDTDRHTAALSP